MTAASIRRRSHTKIGTFKRFPESGHTPAIQEKQLFLVKKMNTLFLVMAEFESAEIKLCQVCESHFGMKIAQARRKASTHDLPVPFYKKTGKSDYYCRAIDWAEYIDGRAHDARQQWAKMNGLAS